MIRKVLVIAFVFSVATNSIAGVLPYIAGDVECEGNCCRIVQRSEFSTNQSNLTGLRCLMQCEHPSENQGLPESPVLQTERDSKGVAQVATAIRPVYATLNTRPSHSIAGIALASTHIYLKTGTLLI